MVVNMEAGKMEIHFPHLTNGIHQTRPQRRLGRVKKLLKLTATLILCSVTAVIIAACNVSGGY